MGKLHRKSGICFAVAAVLLLRAAIVYANNSNIGASVAFQRALSFDANANMDFSLVTFTTDASGSVKLGTDGNITYTDGYSGSGGGTPGTVTLSGDIGETVDISCQSTGAISNGSENIPLINIEIAIGTAVAAGSGISCQGLETVALSHTIAALATQNKIFVGGEIDGSTTPSQTGAFNSESSGGSAVTIRVVYH